MEWSATARAWFSTFFREGIGEPRNLPQVHLHREVRTFGIGCAWIGIYQ
jgi:hypothetical protein